MKKVICWIPTILCMLLIFLFSNEPANVSNITSGGVCETILKIFYKGFDDLSLNEQYNLIESIQFYVRKMAHFSIYATLGVCTSIAMIFQSLKFKNKLIISLGMCLLYAISDEIHQLFVEGRSCQFRDVCIDFCGSIVGTIIFYGIIKFISMIKKNHSKE